MILLPKPPKIISKKDDWAVFEIEALYPGYGVTIGNSLRRTLLSEVLFLVSFSLTGSNILEASFSADFLEDFFAFFSVYLL